MRAKHTKNSHKKTMIINNLLSRSYFNNHATWSRKGTAYNVGVSYMIGIMGGLCFALIFLTSTWRTFGLWGFTLSLFHFWEFNYVALFHPDELSFNSFLLNHSSAYTMAFCAAIAEYFIERMLFPSIKSSTFTLLVGGILVLGGLAVRIVAMFTAGSNFHHLVREEREENHKLVTNGIYTHLRHPSYFGWFWYTVGGQVLLCNPLCVFAYAFASYKFFSERIGLEEEKLIEFFGDDYRKYKSRTTVGIPFIK